MTTTADAAPLTIRQRHLIELINSALDDDGQTIDQELHDILADEDRRTAYLNAAEAVAR